MADPDFLEPTCNRTCQVCRANIATHFCDCQGHPILFCINCVGTHYSKDLRIIHKAIPIAALGKNPEDYERKSKALKEAVAALRSNIERVDQCCQEFDKMVKASIDYFTMFRSWWLNKMQTEKEALSTVIEKAVLEATTCLDNGGMPASPLGQALWTLPPDELQVVHFSVSAPDLQAVLQTCGSYRSDMQLLCDRFSLPQVEEEKSNVAQKLEEVGAKHALSAEVMHRWLDILNTLRHADQLEPLFQKILNLQQATAQIVVNLVHATLELCTRRPETVEELSRGLKSLLDKSEAAPLLANLSVLSDFSLVATVLDAARLQPEALSVCIELSCLLGFFQRDRVPPPNFLASLQRKPTKLMKLAQVCSQLLLNPDNRMTRLSARLVESLEGPVPAKLLIFIPALATDLLHEVPPERVEELGLLLLSLTTDSVQNQIVKNLQTHIVQLRDKLLLLLKKPKKLTITALQKIFPPLPRAEEFKMPQAAPISTAIMAGVFNSSAFVYEIQSQLLSKHTLSVNFSQGGSYVQVDKDTLLCVGAGPASPAAYLLSLSSFELSPLPSLFTPRKSPGLAKVNAQFYVLGGWNNGYQCLNSCEKMQLGDQRWTPSSTSMLCPRHSFTPCYFHSLLYLASANHEGKGTVETYSAETDTFALLSVSLSPILQLGYRSVAFIANGELHLLTEGKQLALWSLETERELRVSSIGRASWSLQPPLIVGSCALIACQGEVQKFNLTTYSFIV